MEEMSDNHAPSGSANFGPYTLIPRARQLQRDGQTVQLGSRALDILTALVTANGAVLSQRELLTHAWPGLTVEDSNLRFHISNLRKVLGDGQDGARYIENVVGRGYCFVAPVRWTEGPVANEMASAVGAPSFESVALPAGAQLLIGREASLAELAPLVLRTRFVTIVGAGGIGKTSLAIALARELSGEYPNGVIFVDLTTFEDEAQIPVAILSALGLPRQSGDLLAAIETDLSIGRTLLILDNCEHMAGHIAAICERLHAALPQLSLLITSREALRAEGEYVHLLPPLALPAQDVQITHENAFDYAAVRLFADRAVASGYSDNWSAEDLSMIGDLVRKLDGIALAIELVASRAGSMGIAGIHAVIDEHLRLLWRGRRNAVPRHQTMQALVDWSYRLLNSEEQKLLLRLSIFAGPFTLHAAQDIMIEPGGDAGAVDDALASLVDKSLLSVTLIRGAVAFRMLETTQAFAAAALAQSDDLDAVFLVYCQHLIERFTADCADAKVHKVQDLGDYLPYLTGMRAALTWAEERASENPDLLVRLCSRLAPVFAALGLLDECLHWSQQGLKHAGPALKGGLEELLLLESLAISAMFTRGNRAMVKDANDRGLEIAEALGLIEHQLHLIAGQNILETRTADFLTTLQKTERHDVIVDNAGTAAARAMIHWMRLINHHLSGNQVAALAEAEIGFAFAPSEEDVRVDYFGYDHRVRALIALARSLWLTGSRTLAFEIADQAIACADQRRQPVSVCIALIYCSTVALWDGQHDLASNWIERAHATAMRHSLGPYQAASAGLRGQLQVELGQAIEGSAEIARALAVFATEDHNILTVAMQASLAKAYLAQGDAASARHTLAAALSRAAASGGSCDEPMLHLLTADVDILESGSRVAGQAALERALACARSQGALPYALDAAVRLADYSGDLREAMAPIMAEIVAALPDTTDRKRLDKVKAIIAGDV